MQKWWSLVFFSVPVLGVALFAVSMTVWRQTWWLPDNVASYGDRIDNLFNIILWITTVTFIVTETALAWFVFRYRGEPGRKGTYIHTHHRTEFIWTVVPALILIYIAMAQLGTWRDIKISPSLATQKPLALVVARQFEWRFYYVGADGAPGHAGVDDDDNGIADWQTAPNGAINVDWGEVGFPGSDDVETVNDLHVPVDQDVVLHLRSLDVLHSFFVPNFRVKQDLVPGMTMRIWFRILPGKTGVYDLTCAELCGWGHYKMVGRVTVDEPAQFQAYLKRLHREQTESKPTAVAAGAG